MKSALLEKLGLAGIFGLGLLLFCLSFYLGHVLPAQAELAELTRERTQLAAAAAAARRESAARPTASAVALPPLTAVPELLTQLNALADKHGVRIERAAYQFKVGGGQRRFEVSMPLKLTYPSLRAYLRDALALAAASLDELSLQKAQASDPAVDAQVRLSFGFAATP